MTIPAPATSCNRLIQAVPVRERNRILARCETMDLVFGTPLCEPGEPFQHAYFPLSGFISLVGPMIDHQSLEMGLIGNEGVLGATLALGINTVPLRGVVQGAGTALRISAAEIRSELAKSPALAQLFNHYLFALMGQLAHTAGCTRFHQIEARLCRWLLMSHDRTLTETLLLTHEFLAEMLGVQRGAVTIAAGTLQSRNLIRYSRGKIRILDRAGLEAASCECYGVTVAAYAQLYR